MTTREQVARALGYPKGMGPEQFDSDHLPSSEQVRRSHSPGWYDARLARARASRKEREAMLARLRLPPGTRN